MVFDPHFPVAHGLDPELEGSGHSVESLVEEGMLIIRSALRLAAKNHLIIRALRDDEPYDRDELAVAVRSEMAELAAEKEADAARLKKAGARAARRRGRAVHQTDYRSSDVASLGLREQMNRRLASRLRTLADDDAFIDGILDAARDAAVTELVSAGLGRTPVFRPDRDYERLRAARMRVVQRDLELLARGDG